MSNPIGKTFYLDHGQCEFFEIKYQNDGEKFICSAEAIIRSRKQGYDKEHMALLKPLGPKTIVGIGTGYGWFEITEVL